MNKRNFLKTGLAALVSTAIPAAATPQFDPHEYFYINGEKYGVGMSMRIFAEDIKQKRGMFVCLFKRFLRRGTMSLKFTRFDSKTYKETNLSFDEVKSLLGFAKNEEFRVECKDVVYQLVGTKMGIAIFVFKKGFYDTWYFYRNMA